jgi:hypothetical protein
VLEALLRGNLQRDKSNEQKLREFALRKQVEQELAKKRQLSGLKQQSPRSGHFGQDGKHGTARDLAASRAGLSSGSHAEKALKALQVADEAARSGDDALIAKAAEVKRDLDNSITTGTRTAQRLGLLPTPVKRLAPQPAAAASAPAPGPVPESQLPLTAVPAPLAPEPAATAEPGAGKRLSVPKELRLAHERERPHVLERWVPAAKAFKETHSLFRQERDRLRVAYGHPKTGVLIFRPDEGRTPARKF